MTFSNEIQTLVKKIVEQVLHAKITRDDAQRLLAELGINTDKTDTPVFQHGLLRRRTIQISARVCAEIVVEIERDLPDRSLVMKDGQPNGIAPFIGIVNQKVGDRRLYVEISDGERTIHLTSDEQRTHKALMRKHLKLLRAQA